MDHGQGHEHWKAAGRRGAGAGSGAATPGPRALSSARKTAAVLRLLQGEDLEQVSRLLGVRAATLTGWRDAFVAAGEAALTINPPATGEDLEGDRLKARLGAALIERDLLEEKIAILEANSPFGPPQAQAMSRAVSRGQRQAVWPGGSLPGLAARPIRGLSPPGRRRGPTHYHQRGGADQQARCPTTL